MMHRMNVSNKHSHVGIRSAKKILIVVAILIGTGLLWSCIRMIVGPNLYPLHDIYPIYDLAIADVQSGKNSKSKNAMASGSVPQDADAAYRPISVKTKKKSRSADDLKTKTDQIDSKYEERSDRGAEATQLSEIVNDIKSRLDHIHADINLHITILLMACGLTLTLTLGSIIITTLRHSHLLREIDEADEIVKNAKIKAEKLMEDSRSVTEDMKNQVRSWFLHVDAFESDWFIENLHLPALFFPENWEQKRSNRSTADFLLNYCTTDMIEDKCVRATAYEVLNKWEDSADLWAEISEESHSETTMLDKAYHGHAKAVLKLALTAETPKKRLKLAGKSLNSFEKILQNQDINYFSKSSQNAAGVAFGIYSFYQYDLEKLKRLSEKFENPFQGIDSLAVIWGYALCERQTALLSTYDTEDAKEDMLRRKQAIRLSVKTLAVADSPRKKGVLPLIDSPREQIVLNVADKNSFLDPAICFWSSIFYADIVNHEIEYVEKCRTILEQRNILNKIDKNHAYSKWGFGLFYERIAFHTQCANERREMLDLAESCYKKCGGEVGDLKVAFCKMQKLRSTMIPSDDGDSIYNVIEILHSIVQSFNAPLDAFLFLAIAKADLSILREKTALLKDFQACERLLEHAEAISPSTPHVFLFRSEMYRRFSIASDKFSKNNGLSKRTVLEWNKADDLLPKSSLWQRTLWASESHQDVLNKLRNVENTMFFPGYAYAMEEAAFKDVGETEEFKKIWDLSTDGPQKLFPD